MIEAILPPAKTLAALRADPGGWYSLGFKTIDKSGDQTWLYHLNTDTEREAIHEAAQAGLIFAPQRRVGDKIEWIGVALLHPVLESRRKAKGVRAAR